MTYNDTIDFPTTVGAFDTAHNGGIDAFATRLNPAGSALTYSTFLGGLGDDYGQGIAVGSGGDAAYVTGTAADDTVDFPTTAGAFDTTHNGVERRLRREVHARARARSPARRWDRAARVARPLARTFLLFPLPTPEHLLRHRQRAPIGVVVQAEQAGLAQRRQHLHVVDLLAGALVAEVGHERAGRQVE